MFGQCDDDGSATAMGSLSCAGVTVTAQAPGAEGGGISDKLSPSSSGIWERRVPFAVQRETEQ